MPAYLETAQNSYGELLSNPLIDKQAFNLLHQCNFLKDCREAAITLPKLKGFVAQHHFYSRKFVNYLCALIANLEDKRHAQALLQNLAEEAGLAPNCKIPHFKLYQKMMEDLKVDVSDYTLLPATKQLIQAMMDCCKHENSLVGLAALLIGAEAIVPYLYSQIVVAFQRHKTPLKHLVFFNVHIQHDDGHAHTLSQILQQHLDLSSKSRALAISIGGQMLKARKQFLDNIYEVY